MFNNMATDGDEQKKSLDEAPAPDTQGVANSGLMVGPQDSTRGALPRGPSSFNAKDPRTSGAVDYSKWDHILHTETVGHHFDNSEVRSMCPYTVLVQALELEPVTLMS
jgi:hypothetical protein